jgi:multicomponent Na+:H+ antiporter subunit G
MREAVTAVLMVVGAAFMLLAAVGLLRLPDLFTRMQAGTKASALGAGCALLGVAVYFGELGTASRAVLVIVFIFLTAPISAHMVARAAYVVGVPLWEHTNRDDLRDHHAERSGAAPAGTPEDQRPTLPAS